MKTRTILLILTVCLGVMPAFAEKQTPPPPGTPKNFVVPTPQKFTLSNGLAVTLIPYGAVAKVTVRLTIRTGSIDEAANQVWLSKLTGDLLTQGTATKTASAIARAAARMGGSLNVSVSEDHTDISGDVLSDSGPGMIELLADVVRHPTFPESELPRLKADRLRELAIAKTRPGWVAGEKFYAVLYPNHPYGRTFSTPKMLQGFTVTEIRSFYDTNFGAARSHLYVAGRFDAPAIEASVRRAFSDWKRGPDATANVPKPTSERGFYLIDRPGAVQSNVIFGMPVIDPTSPDYIPFLVMDALLGGSFNSRITSNIREQKGYTYSPGSYVNAHYRSAIWSESADVTTNVTGPSLKEILAEVKRLQSEPPSSKELEGIENYLAGNFVIQTASRGGVADQFAFLDLHGLPQDYLDNYVKRVHSVTPQEVQGMAAKYIREDKATIVVVGDRKIIGEQIRPFGPIR